MADEKNVTVIRKKKIVGGHGGHHGGAWKVAYADFVTAMMAFFMVMWLMGSDEETKEAIAAYFQNRPIARDGVAATGAFAGGNASGKTAGADGRFEEKTLDQPSSAAPVYLEEYAVLKDLNTYYDGSAFTVEQEGPFVAYKMTPRMRFEFNDVSIGVDTETRMFLARIADAFKQHDGIITLVGYPDQKPDWALAFGRAMAVKRELEKLGVNGAKLIPEVGYNVDVNNKVAPVDLRDGSTVKFVLKRRRPEK